MLPHSLVKAGQRSVTRRLLSTYQHATQGWSKTQEMALMGVGAAGTFGLLSLAAKGFSMQQQADSGAYTSQPVYNKSLRHRLQSTYLHLGGGLAITAGSAVAFWRSGMALRMSMANPWLVLGGTLVGTIASMMVTRSIDYNSSPALKHASWATFNGIMGLSLCPMGVMGGPLLMQAAMGTGLVVGGLSLVAAAAPNDAFMNWGGPLSVGLGVMVAASVGSMFFPQSRMLTNVVLYGGLGLFGLFTLYDTQNLLQRAKMMPQHSYDPVNESLHVYMDTINLFVRIATVMNNSNRR